MPRWIEDLAIDRKLMLIMMLTVGISLIAACLTFVLSDALATYRSAKDELETLSNVVANNSVSALDFDDVAVAEETLATLASTEGILEGCLFRRDGSLLAYYARDEAEAPCRVPEDRSTEVHLEDGRLAAWRPIVFQEVRLGSLYLVSDLSRLRDRLVPYLVGTLLAAGVSGLIALALSSRLKNLITAPILQLAGAVGEVSRTQRYSTRVPEASHDEIGLLMKGFNEMLEQIQIRDDELRRAHDELEQRVVERTAELEVARDAAQAASRAKSEFLANMSHEIRTPLNAVMGLTDVLLGTRLDERQRDFLATIRDSAESLLSVLNDILDFSKIEAGKLDLERVHFSIHDTVDDTLTSLALRAEAKGIEIACYVDPKLPTPLIGDPGRLRQVIANLVSNAIKFTDAGEIVVRVEPQSPLGNSLTLHFSVRDTGIGIPAGKLERLFDPFEQADTSTTRRFGGTGLGLSISRQLVEMMNGQIGVESREGEGSTFHFTARFDVPERARGRVVEPLLPLEGVRVLIVDDNDTNRDILEALTRAKRMCPATARSAGEALRLLETGLAQNDPFQMVLSDVHMPGTDGFDLAETIRNDARLGGLSIVFLTSAGQSGDLERCEQLGVAARLVKPVKQSELFQVMTRTLAAGRVSHDAPTRPAEDARRVSAERSDTRVPPMRILLVEDSAANRKVALALLEGMGHSITLAENGRIAMERLALQDFDVVLMDVQMPEMDGLEATAAIRAREAGSRTHLPIVAMTAHALQGDREKCLAAGMDDYVSKPVRKSSLLEALARAATQAGPALPPFAGGADGAPGAIRRSPVFEELSGDPLVLREIVESYISETRENLMRLPELIDAGNGAEVRRLAHTIKGAMGSFGAAEAEGAARELEELARAGDLSRAQTSLSRMSDAVGAALPDWVAFLETGVIPE